PRRGRRVRGRAPGHARPRGHAGGRRRRRLPLRCVGGTFPRLAGNDRIRPSRTKGGAVKIIVVGAGLAGLVSGRQLQEAGHEVVVLEARNRVGGRVLTVRDGFEDGQYADVGAMILYEGQPNILELCERFDLEVTPKVTFGAELPALLLGGSLIDADAVGAAFKELG